MNLDDWRGDWTWWCGHCDLPVSGDFEYCPRCGWGPALDWWRAMTQAYFSGSEPPETDYYWTP